MNSCQIWRVLKELHEISYRSSQTWLITTFTSNLLLWNVLLLPDNPPYNKGAFKVKLEFPTEYPFKPPKVNFISKIYHPNIDENGQVYLPIVGPEKWKPSTTAAQVLDSLSNLLQNPEPENALREGLAEEYIKDRESFMKNAEEYTIKLSERRPSNSF